MWSLAFKVRACRASLTLLPSYCLTLQAKPEFTFLAPSPVLTARFHEYDPYLIIGSCYSGQVRRQTHVVTAPLTSS